MMSHVLNFSARLGISESRAIYLLTLTLGGFSGLAYAPHNLWPFLLVSICGFLWVNPTSARQAYGLGYVYGFGHYVATLYWLGNAFVSVGLDRYKFLGILGLPVFLSLFTGLINWLLFRFAPSKTNRVLGFVLLWSLWEILFGKLIVQGFPWTLHGMVWPISVLQITSVIGIYGLSFLTTLLFSLIALKNSRIIMGVAVVVASLWGFGAWRLYQYSDLGHHEINVRLVQACIEQKNKWDPTALQDNLLKQVALSQDPGEKPLHMIIWPESSVPFYVQQQPLLRNMLLEAVPPHGYLIFGAPRYDQETKELRASLFAIDEAGKIFVDYDKSHLVPFGEYVPLKKLLPINKLTYGSMDYQPGPGPQTFSLPSFPAFSPLICFEAIFSGSVVGDKRPEWLLNITNDAWYGQSAGPHQHLKIVTVRAIEEGLPLIRATNNGISAVADAVGRILYRLETDDVGYIDFHLPRALPSPPLFSKIKHWGYGIMLAVFGLFALRQLRRKNGRPDF